MGWLTALTAGLLVVAIGLELQRIYPSDDNHRGSQPNVAEEKTAGCFPALFSFGSSVADTGTNAAAFPDKAPLPPHGATFFGGPAARYNDGRLEIDFWATALRLPFLDSYLRSVGSDFRRGVNFAAAGATVTGDSFLSPFHLPTQLQQFQEFKRSVLALIDSESRGSGVSSKLAHSDRLPRKDYFRDALYIVSIGSNDLLRFQQLFSPEDVGSHVPKVSQEILRVVEELYKEGARNILVQDSFPQGCSPFAHAQFGGGDADQLDAAGCLKSTNALVQLLNSLLKQGILELGKRLPDASISLIESYDRQYEIFANHEHPDFKFPLEPCCGDAKVWCGKDTVVNGEPVPPRVCNNASAHILWDFIHFTDAFNRAIMKGTLSGEHFVPPFDLTRNECSLEEI